MKAECYFWTDLLGTLKSFFFCCCCWCLFIIFFYEKETIIVPRIYTHLITRLLMLSFRNVNLWAWALQPSVVIVFRTKSTFTVEHSFWKCVGILKENVIKNLLTLTSKEIIYVNFCLYWILVKIKIICTIIYCVVFFNIFCMSCFMGSSRLLTFGLSFRNARIGCLRLLTCFPAGKSY